MSPTNSDPQTLSSDSLASTCKAQINIWSFRIPNSSRDPRTRGQARFTGCKLLPAMSATAPRGEAARAYWASSPGRHRNILPPVVHGSHPAQPRSQSGSTTPLEASGPISATKEPRLLRKRNGPCTPLSMQSTIFYPAGASPVGTGSPA